jgi:hypothetical protein
LIVEKGEMVWEMSKNGEGEKRIEMGGEEVIELRVYEEGESEGVDIIGKRGRCNM